MNNKISFLCMEAGASDYELYLTSNDVKGHRFFVGETKPYKGNRVPNKPYHYDNLTTLFMANGAIEVESIEADDAIATRQCEEEDTIIVSRDKDFKQVPGMLYSWELAHQPSFGPALITPEEGLSFFFYQMIVGDPADNIPGVYRLGDKFAKKNLTGKSPLEQWRCVQDCYIGWGGNLEEQATLLWLQRKPGEWWSHEVMEEVLENV